MTLPHHASRATGLRAYSLPDLTLATIMGVGVVLVAPAMAGVSAERTFDVPAGEATEALKRFAAQSGQQVVFMGDTVRGEKTRAVKGVHTPRHALELMLAGTRLQVVQDTATGALAVRKAPSDPNAPRAAPTAPKERPPRPQPDHAEQVVELSPFVVSSEQDQGYQAVNTLAGSRLNTPLRDTPASISVLTDEFIRDIGALDLAEAIAFGNNVEREAPDGNPAFEFFHTFRIRGQAAAVARNYFVWKLPTNTYNVERIEEARGPNSILFGIASAGGLLSFSTKQALTGRNFHHVRLGYGSHDLRRVAVDLNQASADGRLGVRLNAVALKAQGFQHYVFNEDHRAHLAVKRDLTPDLVLRVEYEKGRTFDNTADNQEITDGVMRWYDAGRPLVGTTDTATGVGRNSAAANLAVNLVDDGHGRSVNYDARGQGISQQASSAQITDPALIDIVSYTANLGGAAQTQASAFETWSASLDYRLGRSTSLQLAFNRQRYDFAAWQASSPTSLKGDPNRFLRDGVTPNPHAGGLYFETFWTERLRREASDSLRLTVSHEFDFNRRGEYRLAGLAEHNAGSFYNRAFNEAWVDAATNRGAFAGAPSASVNRVLRRHYITPGDYATYYASSRHPDPATGADLISGLVDPGNPARTLGTRMTPANSSGFDDPSEQNSLLLAGQAYYFRRRLVLAAGYRRDALHLHEGVRGLTDPVTGDFIIDNVNHPRTNRNITASTRTLGAVCHVLPWLSLRYNRSNSIELPNTTIRIMPESGIGNRVGDSPRGEGEDFGLDLNLLDGRIFFRATRFSTTRAGAQTFLYGSSTDNPSGLSARVMGQLLASGLVTPAERELHNPNSGGGQLDNLSSGYELSVTANPTPNLRLQANWSVTDAVSADIAPEIKAWAAREIPYFQTFDQNILIAATGTTIGQEIARWQAQHAVNQSLAGVAAAGNRREKFSAVARYTFTGETLPGWHVGAAVRHQGRQAIAATTAGRVLYGNSFTRLDSFLGYTFGRAPRLKFLKGLSLQLNVQNLLDRHDPLIARVADSNAAVVEVNRLVPQEPRAWRLTAELSF